jgi:SNF family Na+-dependent transporter
MRQHIRSEREIKKVLLVWVLTAITIVAGIPLCVIYGDEIDTTTTRVSYYLMTDKVFSQLIAVILLSIVALEVWKQAKKHS